MDRDFITALQSERAQLKEELQKLPLYQRLEAVEASLQTLVSVYADESRSRPIPQGHEVRLAAPAAPTTGRSARSGSMTSQVVETAAELFRSTGRRATSKAILERCLARGIKIASNKPQAQVSSILSHNPLFDNGGDVHGSGYGLREWSESSPPSGGDQGQGEL